MDKKNKTHIYAAYKRLTTDKNTQRLKRKGWKKIFHENGNQKKAEVTVLGKILGLLGKIGLKTKTLTMTENSIT